MNYAFRNKTCTHSSIRTVLGVISLWCYFNGLSLKTKAFSYRIYPIIYNDMMPSALFLMNLVKPTGLIKNVTFDNDMLCFTAYDFFPILLFSDPCSSFERNGKSSQSYLMYINK